MHNVLIRRKILIVGSRRTYRLAIRKYVNWPQKQIESRTDLTSLRLLNYIYRNTEVGIERSVAIKFFEI